MGESKQADSEVKTMSGRKTVYISALILLGAAMVTLLIFKTEPKARRGGAVKETAMLVDVVPPESGDFHPVLTATGVVKPSRQVRLEPLVRGTVVYVSQNFIPGGFLKKGETLLKIDPADYRNILDQKKSELHQALSDLSLEMGRQNVARKDYQLLAETLAEENRSLILREPQLNAVKARVESARAGVNQAELDLQRTVITAPFESHILSRNVNTGSQVSPGDSIGDLVGIDTYWVETTVPISKLRWLEFPGEGAEKGSEVILRHRTAWESGQQRSGSLFKLIGALEAGTRLARALVVVKDPLNRSARERGIPELILGSFVETRIRGREIRNILRLKREYIRKGDTLWVYMDGKLDIRNVKILLKDQTYAYIGAGLKPEELVVTTNLSTVVQGAGLRVERGKTGAGMLPEGGPDKVIIKNDQTPERQ